MAASSCYTDSYQLPDCDAILGSATVRASKAADRRTESGCAPKWASGSALEPTPAPTPAAEWDVQPSVDTGQEPLADQEDPSKQPARLLYVLSSRLQELSVRLPINHERGMLVHSLVEAVGLLDTPPVDVEEARPASIEQLREYHSQGFLAALAHYHKLKPAQLEAVGLQDDCPPFPGVYECAALIAGGSLQAAAALASGRYRTAVHFDGGRHHAHKSQAAGFCYVNDVVLAVLHLLGNFQRIMYVDVDLHHCDAVQEAFNLTDRVLTISLHKLAPGFFPGTGQMGSLGEGRGGGFSLNLPLEDGLRNELFVDAFHRLAGGAAELYKPDCVVLQCGVDGLAHDPLGASWGLTPRGYAAAAGLAASWAVPLLVLGGGGYDDAAAARAWTAVLAALQGRVLPDEIPDHEHMDKYGPNFQLYTAPKPLLTPDANTSAAVAAKCQQLLGALSEALGSKQREEQQEGPAGCKRMRAY